MEEAGQLAGLSEGGQAGAMPIATWTGTLSEIEDSIGPGVPDGGICASVAMERYA